MTPGKLRALRWFFAHKDAQREAGVLASSAAVKGRALLVGSKLLPKPLLGAATGDVNLRARQVAGAWEKRAAAGERRVRLDVVGASGKPLPNVARATRYPDDMQGRLPLFGDNIVIAGASGLMVTQKADSITTMGDTPPLGIKRNLRLMRQLRQMFPFARNLERSGGRAPLILRGKLPGEPRAR